MLLLLYRSAVLGDAEDFTVLIKNSIYYPKFNFKKYACIFEMFHFLNLIMSHSKHKEFHLLRNVHSAETATSKISCFVLLP